MPKRFEVDADLCIGCGLCHERAPANVDVPPGFSHAVVVKQPENPDEERACTEAAEYCPTGGLQAIEGDAEFAPEPERLVAAAACGS